MPNWKKVVVSGSSAHLNHVTASGNVSGSATSTGSFGYIKIPDDGKIALGDSEDLRIYHNGNHSIIRDRGTGNLILRTNAFQVKNADDTETMLQANADGNVTLYHNNNSKLATNSGGVSVTGHVTASGNVSASSTSTASFGTYFGDGGNLTGIDTGLSLDTLERGIVIGDGTFIGMKFITSATDGEVILAEEF